MTPNEKRKKTKNKLKERNKEKKKWGNCLRVTKWCLIN